LIEQALEELGPDQGAWFLSNLTRSNYPKAVDEYLRKRLESDDPRWVSSASYIMSTRGPSEDSGGLCGSGHYLLLVKKNREWVVQQTFRAWVS
jgi:hypothetical protein